MKITLLDDYQDACRTLDAFPRLAAEHDVQVFTDSLRDVDALAARLAETEVLLLIRERTPMHAGLLRRLPRLRLISQSGPIPHIDLDTCRELGITVCSRVVPGRPSYATAELTWGLVIAAWRRIPQEGESLRAGKWQSPQAIGRTLRGRTLGIFGYGKIGAVVADYGRSFGMRVLVWGREGSLERARADGYEIAASQRALFEDSDVVSLQLSLVPETRGIVTAADLAAMKPDALFVNTSRAGLVEPGALLDALRRGRPGAAALDVFDKEPAGADDPLLQLPQVVATPHLGYVERDNLNAIFDGTVDQVLAFARGEPVNVVVPGTR
jgi:D-3-phosphoglycerate dehydrogenase